MTSDELKHFAVLQELTEQEREEVAELLDRRAVAEGEVVFCEGDEADALILLQSGRVELSREDRSLSESLHAGEHLGAFSIVLIGKREATATAEEDSVVFELTRASFRRLADDAPRAGCRLIEGILADFARGLRSDLARLAAPTGEPG